MKFFEQLRPVALQRYVYCLVPATVAYFVVARAIQDQLRYVSPDLPNMYPGYLLRPEPYEIPFYLLSYVAIPLLAVLVYALWRVPVGRYMVYTTGLILTVSAGVFAIRYALVQAGPAIAFVTGYFQRQSVWHALWLVTTKRLYIVRLSFAAAAVVFALGAFVKRWSVPWQRFIPAAEHWLKHYHVVPFFFIGLAVLLFHPNYPYTEGNANYILSPAHAMLRGYGLLYQTIGLYGLLNTYLVAAIMAVMPAAVLTYKILAMVVMGLYFVFYLLLYRLLLRWVQSPLFALLGTWAGVIVGFFLLEDPQFTAYHLLGLNVYRQGFFIVPAFMLILWQQTGKPHWREWTLVSAATGLFWNIETGIVIGLATFAAFSYAELARFDLMGMARFWRICWLAARQFSYVVLVWGVITVVNFAVYGSWPHWSDQLQIVSSFENGYGKLPMPAIGLYQWYVLTYLAFALWIVWQWLRRQRVPPAVPFFTVYGIFSLVYYVGNSAWSYLNFISLPMVVLLLYLFVRSYQSSHLAVNRRRSAALLAIFSFMAVMTVAKVPMVLAYRDYRHMNPTVVDARDEPLAADAQYVRELVSDLEIPIFHEQGGKFLFLADRVNWFRATMGGSRQVLLLDVTQVVTYRQVQELIVQILRQRPPRVFITKMSDPRVADLERYVRKYYDVEKTLQTLTIYQRRAE